MADLRISELQALAGANLAAGDFLPLADISASESRKITVTDFVGNAVTLIADDTIPSGKILFGAESIPGSAIENLTVGTSQLANGSVTAAKLADFSAVDFVSSLPASGAFRGQLAVDVVTLETYCWNGSIWQSIKAAGSVNTIIGGGTGIVNISVAQTGNTVTINTTLDDTSLAAQFLAGPSGGGGSVAYRAIVSADLPTATTTAKGAVSVNGNGLKLTGDQIQIDNTVTPSSAEYHLVEYDANGLITGGRLITALDLPAATSGTLGGVLPGSGLSVSNEGQLNHTNTTSTGTFTKVTIDSEGHITTGDTLIASDIPALSASKIESGQFTSERYGDSSITGVKLANSSVTQIGGAANTTGVVTFPTAEFTGQYFYDSINGDLYLWDGNAWQAITITAGEIIFAGTFDASAGSGTGEIESVTTAGTLLSVLAARLQAAMHPILRLPRRT
jgi:hypothetical protein